MSSLNIDENDIEKFDTFNDDDGSLKATIRLKKKDLYCPNCGWKLSGNGFKFKPVNHQFLTGRTVNITYQARRYRCTHCGFSQLEKNPFAMKGFTVSILNMDNIMRDLRNPQLNYTTIAARYHTSVTMIERYLDSFVVIPKIELPVSLGIDEIHSDMAKRRDAKYLGILIDNDTYNLVDILQSRNKTDLSNFFKSYTKEEREKVLYVTIDMWEPYKELANRYLKNAVVAVDPFHVIEHLTRDFTKVRIRIMNSMVYRSSGYYLLKSWHKLLDSDKYNLDGEPQYNHAFNKKLNYGDLKRMILDLNDDLTKAYYLKERYQRFNRECMSAEAAEKEIDDIIADFQSCGINEYEEFTNLLIHWRKEIINSFIRSPITERRLSNAKTESMNNGLKTYIGISNGLSNFNRFRKRMLYCFNKKVIYAISEKLNSLCRNFKKKDK